MPIYEYRCPNGHTFEVFQRISDAPVETCESCGAGPVEKVLYPVAVHFKGSGFYTTDYGSGKRKAGKESEGVSGEKAEKGGDSGDTKADKADRTDKGEKKKPPSGD
jgi:putative FmdB family regulatory protein